MKDNTAVPLIDRAAPTGPGGECCSGCKYFLPAGPMGGINPADLKAPARGICRRYPPVAQITGEVANPLNPKETRPITGVIMVPVLGHGWCGDFSPVK